MKLIQNMIATAALVGLSCSACHVYAAVDEMPAGLWQLKTKMEMPGMPPEMVAKMGARVMTHCVKPGDQSKWSERKNPSERGAKNCETTDKKIEGNTISWKMKCADGTAGDGTVTHNGKDAYTMVTHINSARGSMKMAVDGKKIADICDKAAP